MSGTEQATIGFLGLWDRLQSQNNRWIYGTRSSRRSRIFAAWAVGLAVICRSSETGREWTQDARSSYRLDDDNASHLSESENKSRRGWSAWPAFLVWASAVAGI